MRKLRDYSGEFNPDLRFIDFTPNLVANLLDVYSRLYLTIDGFWYLAVKERVGNQVALACDMEVLKKTSEREMIYLTKLFNISGNDIVTVMKAIQVTPWMQNNEYQIEIVSQNKAILTFNHCATLSALEKEGEGRENEICKIIEPIVFQTYASYFNPNIKIEYLKLPPRKSKDEICCQWEFNLEK